MRSSRSFPVVFVFASILLFTSAAVAQEGQLWVGPNVNMVSGTTFPDGDPFLQRQNEPSIAVSTRNTMHLMGFVNDYRAVDIPFPIDEKTTGDAWLGVFKSLDGGLSWESTLLTGYPQEETSDSPLFGYEAGADPVVRAGTHGLFYMTGIVFDRDEPARSAVFISRYMDLNNLESGDPISYLDTTRVAWNDIGDYFIDKPWLAVDIPRGTEIVTLQVPQDGGYVEQTIECGNVYLAWAEIEGESPHYRSTIRFSRSIDCGQTWSETPIALSNLDTMNQGVTIAVSPVDGDVWVAWRQFDTLVTCTRGGGYWITHPEEWPVEELTIGDTVYTKQLLLGLLNTNPKGDATYILLHQLVPAKINFLNSMVGGGVQEIIAAADAWLIAHPLGSKPQQPDKDEGLAIKNQLWDYNEGTSIGEECLTGGGAGDAIMVVRSEYGGQNFTLPHQVSTLDHFGQGTTEISFRTNSYPTMTVDDVGRAYLAWATRGLAISRPDAVEGDARIVVTTSMDGTTWTTPTPIDEPEVEGHQIKPTITFGGREIVLAYYDLRRDISGVFERFIADWPDLPEYRHTVDVRAAHAAPADFPVFTDYTIVTSSGLPEHPSDQLSRYAFSTNETGDPEDPEPLQLIQLHFNPPNLPIFVGGKMPFFGDYIDIAPSPPFLPDGSGGWRFNTYPEDGAVFHSAWTDNRDVEAPHDGDWTNYIPPTDAEPGTPSVFDPDNYDVPTCQPESADEGQTRIRNQNTYTARMSGGLYVSVPGASRPLGDFQRAFVVYVRNDSYEDKTFSLTIDDLPDGVEASFDQFEQLSSLEVEIARYSSVARTVFVTSTDPEATVQVDVTEGASGGGVPLTRSVLINGDPSSPVPADSELLDAEHYNLSLMNRNVVNLSLMNPSVANDPTMLSLMNLSLMNPALVSEELIELAMRNLSLMNLSLMNPSLLNLSLMNLSLMNPAIFSLSLMNPALMTPAVTNLSLMNLSLMNPDLQNLSLMNVPVEVQEATWRVENTGTATAGYTFNMLAEDVPETGFEFQLFVYKTYATPVADGCELFEELQQQMLVNVLEPEFLDPDDDLDRFLDPEAENPDLDNVTFYLEPGEEVYVTLWIIDLAPPGSSVDDGIEFTHDDVGAAVVAHGVNTDEIDEGGVPDDQQQPFDSDFDFGEEPLVDQLVIDPVVLPDATVAVAYSYTLTATGGLGDRTWSFQPGSTVPAGLTLDTNGNLSWTPITEGTYYFTARVIDSTQLATHQFSVNVVAGIPASPVSWWPGDNSGDDVSGPNGSTLNNGATYAPGLDGRAFSFDGTGAGGSGNYAEASGIGIDSLEELTVSAWVRLNTLPPRIQRFITLEPPGSEKVVLGVDATGISPQYFVSMQIGGTDYEIRVDDVLQTGCFHHVAAAYDGTAMRAFLDGVEVGNRSVSGRLDDGTDTGVWFSSPGEPLDGLIDEVKIFDRAFYESDIASEYDAGGPGKCAPPHVATLVFGSQPHDAIAGQSIGPVVLKVLDPDGNFLPGWEVNVALGTSQCAGATFTGSGDYIAGATGEITVSVPSIDGGGWNYTLAATTDFLGDPVTAISQPFNLIGFCETSSMTTPRVGASATRLADGRVLVAGGVGDANNPLASAEIFDPYTGTWSLTGSMSGPRSLHTANLMNDGLVFVTGGTAGSGAGSALATTEVFDPAAGGGIGAFTSGPAMTTARMVHRTTNFDDRDLLVTGGRTDAGDVTYLDTAVTYDQVGGFSATGDPMTTARDSHTSSLLADARVLLVGGLSAPSTPLDSAEVFEASPGGGTFSATGNLGTSRLSHTATTLADGRVLITGGTDGTETFSSVEIFDPLDGIGSFSGTGAMSEIREQHTAATLPNGNILIAGGITSAVGIGELLHSAEVFDRMGFGGTGSFEATHGLKTARRFHTMTELYDGRVLVTGGYGSSGTSIADSEVYWPINGEVLWTRQIGTADDERGKHIAVNESSVYVAGTASEFFAGSGGADFFVGKFDTNGNQVWMRGFGFGDVDLEDISVHGSGLYIVGTNYGGLPGPTGTNAFVRKYDLDGNEVWTRVFGANDIEMGRGVEVSDSGVYVVGNTGGSFPGYLQQGNGDAFIRKYNFDGDEVWTRQFGTVEADYPLGVSIHESSVYVVGGTYGEFPGQTYLGSSDVFVARFGTDGSEAWIRQTGTTEQDDVGGISAHGSGVYFVGDTEGVFPGEVNIGLSDAFVGRYDVDGTLMWTRQFGTSAWDHGNAVSVDDSGVYVGGEANNILPGQLSWADDDAYACKYDFDGNVIWNKQFGAPVEDRVRGIALDGSSVYLVGEAEGSVGGQAYFGENDVFIIKIMK